LGGGLSGGGVEISRLIVDGGDEFAGKCGGIIGILAGVETELPIRSDAGKDFVQGIVSEEDAGKDLSNVVPVGELAFEH